MQQSAYVSAWGVCLPNAPVDNVHIEDVLGQLRSQSSAVKRRVLMNNGITTRYYAIDPSNGSMTHTNAQMTAEAIRNLCRDSGFATADLQCLACGTASADQIIPSHAAMVHAELGCPPCEVISTSGVCCSGISALKYGFLNVASAACDNAIVTGSELASPFLRASHFEPQIRLNTRDLDDDPLLPFSNEFLRWMLSDGAGALLITSSPNNHAPSLHVDWIDLVSFANESDVCMYLGLQKNGDGTIKSYLTVRDEAELFRDGFLSVSQDVRVLNERLPALMRTAMNRIRHKRNLVSSDVDWILPHYSSQWFRQRLYDGLVELGFELPWERWFTNLSSKGNTGSAAIYIMLEELMSSGKTQTGERILCIVPESSRMLFGFAHFTIV